MNTHFSVDDRFQTRMASRRREQDARPIKSVSSASLFQGAREITIDHGESVYRLKITRQGKLILNK